MTNAWRLMAVLVCVGGLTSAWTATAQDEAVRNPIDLGVGLRMDYTDNRDATEDDKQDNFDFYLTPRIDAYVTGERTALDFFYAPSLRYRTDPSDTQNDTELLHALGLKIDHALTEQTKVRLYESFSYQDDPSISDGSVQRANQTYILNNVELGLRQDLSRWSYADLSGEYMMKRYEEDDVADESDEDRLSADGLLWRQLSPTLGVRGSVGMAAYTYESSLGLDRDFDVYTLAVGLDKIFSPEVRGGLDVGVQSSEYSDDTLDSKTSPYGLLTALIAPNPAFRINGSFGHGVRESDAYPFASQEYSEFRGGIEADPSPIMTVGLNSTYRMSDYDNEARPVNAPAPAPGDSDSGDETTIGIAAHSAWKIGDNARLTLRHLYEDVDSDVAESFSKNTSTIDLQLDI